MLAAIYSTRLLRSAKSDGPAVRAAWIIFDYSHSVQTVRIGRLLLLMLRSKMENLQLELRPDNLRHIIAGTT